MADTTGQEPGPDPALPPQARPVGAILALGAAAYGVLRIPGFLAQGLPGAAATSALLLGATAAFGVLLAIRHDAAARFLAWLGVPRTRGGVLGFTLVLVISLVLFGLLALTSAVAGIEYLAQGRSLDRLFAPPSFGLILVNLALNLLLFLVAAFGYLKLARDRGLAGILRDLGFKGGPLEAGEGVLWAIGGMLLLGAIGALLSAAGLGFERNVLAELITQSLTFPQALVVSFLAAFGEEVFFRGFLQPRIGLVPQALLFAIAHASYLNVLEIVGTLILGLALGAAMARTDSVYGPIAGHFTVNALAFAAARFA